MSSNSLSLYRSLLRYGQSLVHTDKKFFYNRVRKEFRDNRDVTDPKQIETQQLRANTLLTLKRIK